MKRLLLTLTFLVLVSGCTHPQDSGTPGPDLGTEPAPGTFYINYPKWVEEPPDGDPNTILLMQSPDFNCKFRVNAINDTEDWYLAELKTFVEQNGGTILSENPLDFEIAYGGFTHLTKVRSAYCDSASYFVIISCVKDSFNHTLAENVFSSMGCKRDTISFS